MARSNGDNGDNSHSKVPEGASSLMGMFQPPPSETKAAGTNSGTNIGTSMDQSDEGVQVDGKSTTNSTNSLFSAQPPPPPPPPPTRPPPTPPARPPPSTTAITPLQTNASSSAQSGPKEGKKKEPILETEEPQTPTRTPRLASVPTNPLVSTPPNAAPLLSMFDPPKSKSKSESALPGSSDHQKPPTGRTSTSNLTPRSKSETEESSKNPSPSGATNLMAMFDGPSPTGSFSEATTSANSIPKPAQIDPDDRQSTVRLDNTTTSEHTGLLDSLYNDNTKTPKSSTQRMTYHATTTDDNEDDGTGAFQALLTPKLADSWRRSSSLLPNNQQNLTRVHKLKQMAKTHVLQPTTFAGAFMFLFYHVVFCLANGSAIVRPSSQTPILGVMAKWTAVGILLAGPLYIYRLNKDAPALYPCVDLFLAPFLASAAAVVDQTLNEDGITDNTVFLASFAVLAAIGMFLSGFLLLLAAKFKLANLGTFLPYSVLCGFFSSMAVLLWALAFSVDNNGKTWQKVFFSGDWHLIGMSLLHHLPSLAVGILMNQLGPKHPLFVILINIACMIFFYLIMWITGTSLEEAQEQEWFWKREELIIQPTEESGDGMFSMWVPPVPLGHISALFEGLVHWKAVYAGLSDMCALAFLYLLRCSIHSSAMKKNVNNLVCKTRVEKPTTPKNKGHARRKSALDTFSNHVGAVYESLEGSGAVSGVTASVRTKREFKKQQAPHLQIELATDVIFQNQDGQNSSQKPPEYEYIETRPKPCRRSLQSIFMEYGYGLWFVAFTGGFGVLPTMATANTMYAIGAGGSAPQYGSVLLLVGFYLTDFALVRYIPKACFSSLLVLAAVNTFVVWFCVSYRKTQDILEWMVVPLITLFSLVVGFLNAVFLGIGISTFVFVAAFFRVGVVKFNATGLEIRSTVERSSAISEWLDNNGDLIRVICLQNYLMFMNASSILSYIETMFEDLEDSDDEDDDPIYIPPTPKVLIMDMSLNTGMDTSTMDIFAEIRELCKNNGCKLFLCGLGSRTKKGLSLAGVKPEPGLRDKRLVRFFPDVETALGKAEDLITFELYHKEKDIDPSGWRRPTSPDDSGFRIALKEIDDQHGQDFSNGLIDLEPHAVPIELKAGEHLFASDGGQILDSERGLFFIESGMLKIERDAGHTLTRTGNTVSRTRSAYSTLNNQHARKGTFGKQVAALRANHREPTTTQTFRLARIGPGWVCGAIEGASGLKHAGVHIAVTNCRLHHISFDKLKSIEDKDPKLSLRLYKMLSHLMARRQEITIEQLATFRSIMSSPAHSKPLNRAALMALRR